MQLIEFDFSVYKKPISDKKCQNSDKLEFVWNLCEKRFRCIIKSISVSRQHRIISESEGNFASIDLKEKENKRNKIQ